MSFPNIFDTFKIKNLLDMFNYMLILNIIYFLSPSFHLVSSVYSFKLIYEITAQEPQDRQLKKIEMNSLCNFLK